MKNSMRIAVVAAALIGLMLLISTCAGTTFAQEGLTLSGESARQKLVDGNKRYVGAKPSHPNQTSQRRAEIVKGQHPFAAILSCSDSRVPPEIIFDQGLGDLFVIRVAGNIVDDAVLGSLEYAVEHLNIKYIMVLGHSGCGAVDATVKGGEVSGHMGSFIKAIQPAFEKVKNLPGDIVDNAVMANVTMVVGQLKSSEPVLGGSVRKGTLIIDGARYDLDDGKVTILP